MEKFNLICTIQLLQEKANLKQDGYNKLTKKSLSELEKLRDKLIYVYNDSLKR